MSLAAAPGNDCPLLALPAELVTSIVEFAVLEDEPIDLEVEVHSSSGSDKITYTLTPGIPALARTCKLFWKEVPSIYFTENAFTWRPTEDEPLTTTHGQFSLLSNVLGGHVNELRHFNFNVEHMVDFEKGRARREFQARIHKSKDGTIKCEYHSRGSFNPLGMPNKSRFICCGCDLLELAVACQERGDNLLAVGDAIVDRVPYFTRYETCDSCGLPKNAPRR